MKSLGELNNIPRILVTGDFCPVNRINESISTGNVDAIFSDMLPIVKGSDLTIVNLECPLTDNEFKIRKVGPSLKGSISSLGMLKHAGFNLATLANNHIMDFGIEGLKSTIQGCKDYGIDYLGAGENYQLAKNIYFKKIRKYNIAVLNFSENEYSTTYGEKPGANPLDPIENYRDIAYAKTKADFVIVIVHGGHETYDLPSLRMKNTLRFYAEAGADAVLAHHAHCFSGYEIFNGTPIFYGLGNFIFDDPKIKNSKWNYGMAVELFLEDTVSFKIIPYEQCNSIVGIKLLKDQELVNFYNTIDRLNLIISRDELLKVEFDKFCNSVSRRYYSFLEPHSNRFLHFLRNRRLFPSFLSEYKTLLYLNLVRCESHRDVILDLLDKKAPISH